MTPYGTAMPIPKCNGAPRCIEAALLRMESREEDAERSEREFGNCGIDMEHGR